MLGNLIAMIYSLVSLGQCNLVLFFIALFILEAIVTIMNFKVLKFKCYYISYVFPEHGAVKTSKNENICTYMYNLKEHISLVVTKICSDKN